MTCAFPISSVLPRHKCGSIIVWCASGHKGVFAQRRSTSLGRERRTRACVSRPFMHAGARGRTVPVRYTVSKVLARQSTNTWDRHTVAVQPPSIRSISGLYRSFRRLTWQLDCASAQAGQPAWLYSRSFRAFSKNNPFSHAGNRKAVPE